MLEENGIDSELFLELLCNVLGSFSFYRPDIGFISGLEKICSLFALIFMSNLSFDSLDNNFEALEFKLFSFLANQTQTKDRHIGAFLMSESDEISWRLDYFDKVFERELP
jgi:Rab-GTPase-TBC domain